MEGPGGGGSTAALPPGSGGGGNGGPQQQQQWGATQFYNPGEQPQNQNQIHQQLLQQQQLMQLGQFFKILKILLCERSELSL